MNLKKESLLLYKTRGNTFEVPTKRQILDADIDINTGNIFKMTMIECNYMFGAGH
jgi:hypothetical protein